MHGREKGGGEVSNLQLFISPPTCKKKRKRKKWQMRSTCAELCMRGKKGKGLQGKDFRPRGILVWLHHVRFPIYFKKERKGGRKPFAPFFFFLRNRPLLLCSVNCERRAPIGTKYMLNWLQIQKAETRPEDLFWRNKRFSQMLYILVG